MKAMKKILATVISLCLIISCVCISTSAAEANKGSITIQNPGNSEATVAGKIFNVYKVFNATTSGTNVSYSWYKVAGENQQETIPFYDFFYGAEGIVKKNESNGNVQDAIDKISKDYTTSFELSQLAESMHQYIVKNNISPVVDPIQAGNNVTSVKVDDLSYGYYLVYDDTNLADVPSAVRSAVMLTNVNADAMITLKANRPQIEKYVLENDGVTYGKGTSATIGDTIKFKISTAVPSHTMYSNYTYYIEDKLPQGLALNSDSIKVYKGEIKEENLLVENTHYTLTKNTSGDVSFKVDFTDFIDSVKIGEEKFFATDDILNIVYTADVTTDILPQVANQNIAVLTYSNDPTNDDSTGSVDDFANVFSYQFVFTKFSQDTNGVITNVRLSGAEFQLYKVSGETRTLIKFKTETGNNEHQDGEDGGDYTKYIVDPNGSVDTLEVHDKGNANVTLDHINMGGHLGDVFIFGLAEGTYELVETKAPDGYVLPDKPFEIKIVDQIATTGTVGTLEVTGSHTGSGSIVNTSGTAEKILTVWAEITNKPGSALPETGGIGTTLFSVIGIALMASAIAYFVLRKRNRVK